jgi:hypothetical protein
MGGGDTPGNAGSDRGELPSHPERVPMAEEVWIDVGGASSSRTTFTTRSTSLQELPHVHPSAGF